MTGFTFQSLKPQDSLSNELRSVIRDNVLQFYAKGLSTEAEEEGLTAERPAFQNLLAAIHENRVQKIVVVSLDRLYRSYLAALQFLDDMEQRGISICSITDGDLPLCRELYHGIVNAYRSSSEKGGECR